MSVSLDYSELSEFNKEMLELIETKYPKEAKKFISRAGNAFRTEMKARYKKHTIRRTGNLLRGVVRGRAYIYNGEDFYIVAHYCQRQSGESRAAAHVDHPLSGKLRKGQRGFSHGFE